MNRFLITALCLSASVAFGQNLNSSTVEADAAQYKSWKVSLIPLFAAHGLDAGSSWGRYETNPLLADPSGRFGMRSAGVKFSMVGAAVLAEYLLMKRHPKWAKLFKRANYGNAAMTTGFAVHNFAVR